MLRTLKITCFSLVLSACAATSEQARSTLSAQYVGHSVDELVARFGPPGATFKMASGSMAYSWSIASAANIEGGRYGATAQSFSCTLQVIADGSGRITNVNTTDAQNGLGESLCATRLGLVRQ